jgi:SnoaL-like domain
MMTLRSGMEGSVRRRGKGGRRKSLWRDGSIDTGGAPVANDFSTARRIENAIRTYVKALNDADDDGIAACFCQDAVHYFASIPKVTGAATLGAYFADSVRKSGISWTVDQMVIDVDRYEAVLEWTRFDPTGPRHTRGMDWFVFEPLTLQFREVRCYGGKGSPDPVHQELQGFDYPGRGYPMQPIDSV